MAGSCFYVPRNPGADHAITQAVGPETAALIADYFHGRQLVLPVGFWRRRAIVQMGETLSGDEIARQLRLSRSYVYEVLAEAKREREPDLFG